jgi:signal transduction histidine kinase
VKRAGDPPDGFYIVIEGQIEWTSRVGKQDVYVMTLADGEFWGHELLLTDKPYPVSGRALNEARVYVLETDAFWRMLSNCPSILRRLVAILVERWGSLGTVEQQYARLASLGTMAAGLAHELNNPAAASRRMIGGLRESLEGTQALASKLEVAIERICELVEAVKQYSYMDRAPLQEIDVHHGLENTLTMLSHKLKGAEIDLIREYDEGLPHIKAYGSELNQVWTILIDKQSTR